MAHTCPVCGYSGLERDPEYVASFEICPCCRFHFRVDDDDKGISYEQWRGDWIKRGMLWDKGSSPAPAGWDPAAQLKNIGVELGE